MPPVADDAICLRHYDWSETSQTVVLLTRQQGLARALAKGARRARSSFSGGVELLARADIQLYPRDDKDLDLLGTWDLTDPHLHLRRSLPALNAALYAADITAHLLDAHDPHPAAPAGAPAPRLAPFHITRRAAAFAARRGAFSFDRDIARA